MCNFFSCIITEKNLEIYHNPYTDSHEELIDYFGFKDDKIQNKWVRVEFVSQDNKYDDIQSYQLKCDETVIPDWFTENRENIINKLRQIIKTMIITDSRKILLGGCYILSGNAKINLIKSAQVKSISDNAQVKSIYGNAQVKSIYGNAKIINDKRVK